MATLPYNTTHLKVLLFRKEWTAMDLASSLMEVADRNRWRRIVVESSVVQQRLRKIIG